MFYFALITVVPLLFFFYCVSSVAPIFLLLFVVSSRVLFEWSAFMLICYTRPVADITPHDDGKIIVKINI